MSYILSLASWYPNRTDAFIGDFVERHVHSISKFRKVIVLHITKDENKTNENDEIEINKENENLVVYNVYYKKKFSGNAEKILSSFKYFRLQKKIVNKIIKKYGKPELVHLHIAMKAGLMAIFIKKKYGIPYVITENWTGYYRQSSTNIFNSGWLFKFLIKQVFVQANLLLAVTKDLGVTINSNLIKIPFSVIPNVVDTNHFYYKPQINKQKFEFIHISSMNHNKNAEGILRAVKLLSEEEMNFIIVMIGSINKNLISLAEQLSVKDFIVFKNEIPYSEVAQKMQSASAFILFSIAENLPCVILEALCCGLPIISSDVGGIWEVVNQSNGILVESGNEYELKEAMKKMITNYNYYNRKEIANQAAGKFNYSVIGKQFDTIYKKIR